MKPLGSVAILVLASFTVLAADLRARAEPPSQAFHIVAAKRAVAPGEHVELRLAPTPPQATRVGWFFVSGPSRHEFYGAEYRAPYVIPPGAPPVEVGVGLSNPERRTLVTAALELTPGVAPGAEDCLGSDQLFSQTYGDIAGHAELHDLPHLIHAAPPVYPASAFARGLEDTIVVHALVCRSGRILDAYVPLVFLDPGDRQPLERDPKLMEAALAAVRQYTFSTGNAAGWFSLAVVFRR